MKICKIILFALFIGLMSSLNAQNKVEKSEVNDENYQSIYEAKQKLKLEKMPKKEEMAVGKSNNKEKVSYTNEDILNKIAYLREQQCCEEEIKELESKLEK
ncbi:MAG: hypothetical protein KDE33_13790 [Bacteroidetes bacterium]|nr:hypothetical protein [Bacteroidota bacterium]MCB9226951.1 hypothetical protein [Chitinophagales bacterium]